MGMYTHTFIYSHTYTQFFSELIESSSSFYLLIVQCVFSKNKGILFYNQITVFKFRNF